MNKRKHDNKFEMKKCPWLFPAMSLFLLAFQQAANKIGGVVADMFSYKSFDEYNIFAWISVHHIVQAIIALVLIAICVKAKGLRFGFGLGDIRSGLRHTLFFTIVVFLYVLVTYFIGYSINSIQAYDFPLNLKNVVGTLAFQLLLSGASEAVLFVALPIALLTCCFKTSKHVKIDKLPISLEVIIAAVLFSVAHVSWGINPFTISADIIQLVMAFIYGIFYGVAYQKSKSVIYPMAMHGISNFLMVGVGYIFAIIFG